MFYYETYIKSHIIPFLLSISDRWYHDVWSSTGWDDDDNDGVNALNHPRTQRYRTVPPTLVPVLRMSTGVYDFLITLTSTHKQRAVTTPPSGKLYEDARNEHVLVYVGTTTKGRIVPRDLAKISPFDSSVQGGED